jgi:hypothetical protein
VGTQSHGTLDRAAVALRAVIAVCLLTLAVTALLPGPHSGHASAAASSPHVLGVAMAITSAGHRTVEVRVATPLPAATTASVSLGRDRVRWACASRTGHPRLLTCPVSGLAARMSDPSDVVVVHI